ncbi:MAG: V-type ATP synthase subunit F [Thermoplasmata archaeon]|nr:V-type ATP synthase subunit F [Thermoplasmata archaeon]MCJ7561847.1 V-type ATP synthase subunit F [Thermoplasmata archaeon]TFG68452.1 MAG: V-type ATP synthase subunit F [Methanomassiliicoccus sp.]
MEIAVVGSEEFVVGFRLAGIRMVYGVEPDKLQETILQLLEEKSVGILAVHSKDIERLPQPLRDRMMASVDPVVIPVGEEEGDMRDKIRRAMGIDLYKTK